ncbi:hypothetical protein Liucustia_55 [Acinetobacter phage Liucustia]|nr:hypothetical protein Liucustia_55 [Acinetobacter phage Liucustia]
MLKGNQVIFVYGDPSSTLATLEELKEYMGGGDVGGVTKEYVDGELAKKADATALTAKADKTYVDAELAKKIGLLETANEGDILTFTGGEWTAVPASQPA